jgi:hypothetical protein
MYSRSNTLQSLPPNDALATFRHMVGIHSSSNHNDPHALIPDPTHFSGRPAPNHGIYTRVVKHERAAKFSYKFASIGINGCLGLQIIVAASLTAMGAANTNHVGITAFGAINTVIAGLLTYLKGSGLPNRLRYYENEWKKVREYIEQREREFSHGGGGDVYETVSGIEEMYEGVKRDVQNNTPDNYVSVGGRGAVPGARMMHGLGDGVKMMHGLGDRVKHVGESGLGGEARHTGGNKLKELELKYGHRVTDFLEGIAHKEEERMRKLGDEIAKNVEGGKAKVVDGRRDVEKEIEVMKEKTGGVGRDAEEEMEIQRARVSRLGQHLDDESHLHGQRSMGDSSKDVSK